MTNISAPQANSGPTISQFSNVEPFVPTVSNVVSDNLPSQINAGKSSQSRRFSAAENAESSSRFQMPFVSRPISHVPHSFTSFGAAPKPLIATSTQFKPFPHNISTIKTPVYVSRSDAVIQPKPHFVQTLSHDNSSRHSYLHQIRLTSQVNIVIFKILSQRISLVFPNLQTTLKFLVIPVWWGAASTFLTITLLMHPLTLLTLRLCT